MAEDAPRALSTTTLPPPELRDRVISLLSDAFAHDKLDVDEFERRITIAQTSSSGAEVEALTADLPGATTSTALVPARHVLPAAQVRQKASLVAILGGTERKGVWRVPRKLRVLTLMGGAVLDFRDAELPPGPVEVQVSCLMGGAHIIVPPHLAVEAEGFAIMGGFSPIDRAPSNPAPDAPVLYIKAFAMMGGVHVEMRLPGESERDAHRRRKRERKALRLREK